MADLRTGEEIILKIPKNKLNRSEGCGLDFGGSLMKVAYATEADENVEIHFRTYPFSNVDDVMGLLSDTICRHVNLDGGIHPTGVGSAVMFQQLRTVFGERIRPSSPDQCPSEFVCFVKSIQYLSNISPLSDITYTPKEEVIQKGRMIGSAMREFRNIFNSGGRIENSLESRETPKELCYPFLLYMCGSAGVPIKVFSDGTLQWLCHNYSGGKHFLAMGCALTGAKTFEELLQLAKTGDCTAVDTCGIHVKPKSDKPPPMTIPDECRMYHSGQLVGKTIDDVKKEDLAASLLFSVTRLLAYDSFSWAHMADCKQIVYVGSLIDHSIIRDQMTRHLEERHAETSQDKAVDYHFMKYAGFLGSLGSLLLGLQ